jgi:hypothetical protein
MVGRSFCQTAKTVYGTNRENSHVLSLGKVHVRVGSKGEILAESRCFPLHPCKRTSGGPAGMSFSHVAVKFQKPIAQQQMTAGPMQMGPDPITGRQLQ